MCWQSAAASFTVYVWKVNSSAASLSTCFSLIYLLFCRPTFLFWWLSYLKAALVVCVSNDRFLLSPSTRLFCSRESISFSLRQTWWIWCRMPGLLRGAAGSQPSWPWLNVSVLNGGTSRQPGIRWLTELSLCVFVCLRPASAMLLYQPALSHFTSLHFHSFYFSGSFINLTCGPIN